MSKLLEIHNLKKYFSVKQGFFRRHVAEIRAVDDISFDIKEGEIVGLVGESGSGKSTAAWASIRLIEPTSGQILFKNTNVREFNSKELTRFRTQVQMIFQDPLSSLNPRKTILENMGEALLYHRLVKNRKEQIDKVSHTLEQIGLTTQALNQYPHQFSGGQQQRISIGRAVALRPKLIICDEAVSALDTSVKGQILNLLEDLKKNFQLSYFFISHDLNLVRFFCSRILVMYKGRIIESGSSKTVFEQAKHPYTQVLVSSIPRQHPKESKARLYPRILQNESILMGCPFFGRCPVSKPSCAHEAPPTKINPNNGHMYKCIH